jgi:hypothetical protein
MDGSAEVKNELDFGFSITILLDDANCLGISSNVNHGLEGFWREKRGNQDGLCCFSDEVAFIGRE